MDVRETTDLFQHRYYRLNKMFLKCFGLWPYQTIRARSVLIAIVLAISVSQMVPQTIAIVKHRHDFEFLIECCVPLTFDAFCLTKLFTSVFNSQKMLKLLNRMRADWQLRGRDHDAKIYHEYADTGRKFTISYAVVAYTTFVIFVTQPILPKVIDTIFRNGTEEGEFVVPVDYLVIDPQKYFFFIFLHTAISGFMAFSASVACDAIFMVYIQHACGLYAALGRNLERITKSEMSSKTEKTTHMLGKPSVNYKVTMCIDRHNEAIKYAELIEANYSWYFFFMVGLNVFLISITGLEIVMRTTNPQQTVKFIASNIVSMIHLFIGSYMAQILMDHSIKIRSNILEGEWYKLPLKAQKLLLFMLMRCNMPTQLTAGKMCVMSIESFGVLLKTSLSYFTLLHSM